MTVRRSLAFGLSVLMVFVLTACAEIPHERESSRAPHQAEVLGAGPEDNPLLGRWQALDGKTGSWTIYSKIAFTKERMYVEDSEGRLLHFKVKRFRVAAKRVSAQTAFGETYAFERVRADLICFEGARIQALDQSRDGDDSGLKGRGCYRRV